MKHHLPIEQAEVIIAQFADLMAEVLLDFVESKCYSEQS
jgi:hypothetical protein